MEPRSKEKRRLRLIGEDKQGAPNEKSLKVPFLQALAHFSFYGQANEKELLTTAIFLLTDNRCFDY